MNASERVNNVELASKIATVVNLFKQEFPDISADLSPWSNHPHIAKANDPDSIDIAFNFASKSAWCECCTIFVQIRFFEYPDSGERYFIGVNMMGYDAQVRQWRYSSVDYWRFLGMMAPAMDAQIKLRRTCYQIFQLFA